MTSVLRVRLQGPGARYGCAVSRRRPDPRTDLHEVFLRVQEQMLAGLAASTVFEHKTACGTATERRWIDLFNRYLPQRYCSTSAFIIDADGRRSHQIDLAIYDRFYSPLWFHDASQPYIPVESVYAIFEIKQTLGPMAVLDCGRKAASVRRLRRTSAPLLSAGSIYPAKAPAPIVAGVLSLDTTWDTPLAERMTTLLERLRPDERLDVGCVLRRGSFEDLHFSQPEEALIFFMLRLMSRLQQMGAAPAIDFAEYSRSVK
jgi:hypothetical protein